MKKLSDDLYGFTDNKHEHFRAGDDEMPAQEPQHRLDLGF